MADVLRGEIWRSDIEAVERVVGHEQGGPRPVLVLSDDRFNANTRLVIAALITAQPPNRPYPSVVTIASVPMPKPSWVLAHQVRTLSVERLKVRMARISDAELAQVTAALFGLVMDVR